MKAILEAGSAPLAMPSCRPSQSGAGGPCMLGVETLGEALARSRTPASTESSRLWAARSWSSTASTTSGAAGGRAEAVRGFRSTDKTLYQGASGLRPPAAPQACQNGPEQRSPPVSDGADIGGRQVHPKVKQNASTRESRNSISNRRSEIGLACRMS
jgi:hypothetical protein